MTETRRIALAWIYLGILFTLQLIKMIWTPEGWFNGFAGGMELVLILATIGFTAKLAGSMGVAKKVRIQSQIILILATLLAVYIYLI